MSPTWEKGRFTVLRSFRACTGLGRDGRVQNTEVEVAAGSWSCSLVTWGPNLACNKHIFEHRKSTKIIENLHPSSFIIVLHHGSGSLSTFVHSCCASVPSSCTPSRASASPWTKNSSRTCHAQIRLIPGCQAAS